MLSSEERKEARAWSKRRLCGQNCLGHAELREQLQIMVAGYDELLRDFRASEKTLGGALRAVRIALRKHRRNITQMRANNHHYCESRLAADTCPDETCENLTDRIADLDVIAGREAKQAYGWTFTRAFGWVCKRCGAECGPGTEAATNSEAPDMHRCEDHVPPLVKQHRPVV